MRSADWCDADSQYQSTGKVWVECDQVGNPLRIFRNKKLAVMFAVNPNRGLAPEPIIRAMSRRSAVQGIRKAVFVRDEYQCVRCGKELTWESAEMDEKIAKGDGGDVSVDNGQTLCNCCHTSGPNAKHNRNPKWSPKDNHATV